MSSHTPLLGLLGLVFVTLKLTGHIDWSWWWVTLPFWGGFIAIVVIMVTIAVASAIKPKRKRKH